MMSRFGMSGLLVAIVAFNVLFPVTSVGLGVEILYYLAYSVVLASGVWIAGGTRGARTGAVLFGVLAFVMGVANAVLPFRVLQANLWGVALVGLQAVLIASLVRYMFGTRRVTRDVLLAGVTVYLLLGTIFIPIYTQVEVVLPGSFQVQDAASASTGWTQFLYFSYVTLTTLGYGDMAPVGSVAQALAVSEAIIGVLYIAVLMARLVGLYAAEVHRPQVDVGAAAEKPGQT